MKQFIRPLMLVAGVGILTVLLIGCRTAVKVNVIPDSSAPLAERTLKGSGEEKILVIPIKGMISNISGFSLLYNKPNMVQEIVSQLHLAKRDPKVKAVILKINSPGGTTTASDILYHEITEFKKQSGTKIVAAMMDLAASGGYEVSLPADCIIAHPTTVTGSVGVIFMRPKLSDLMNKIGVGIEVDKSGVNKDMGSPFRLPTRGEEKMFKELIEQLGSRFLTQVQKHRNLSPEALKKVATARVFLAEDAQKLGLIDEIGYLDDAIAKARKLAGLDSNARVIVYRRNRYPDDNIYNTNTSKLNGGRMSLIDLGILNSVVPLRPGFYSLWMPGAITE